jgi:hypothetical protein
VIDSFDLDKDGNVSLMEFEKYCLSIDHLSWRAEKRRAGNSVSQSIRFHGCARRTVWPAGF